MYMFQLATRRSSSSLSARRAWIEIIEANKICQPGAVALRKESVDRNPQTHIFLCNLLVVALRKESVDRNRVVGKRGGARL